MKKVNDIRTGRHCVFLLHAHLVFVTKYRYGVFTKIILDGLKEIFASVCRDFEAELIEFDGEEDHVHLLVVYPPKVAISSLVNSLKGVSGRLIRRKGYPPIQKKLWGGPLWSPGYFAGSAEERLSLFCGSISKLNERPIKGKNSSYGAPYIPALKGEALRRAG